MNDRKVDLIHDTFDDEDIDELCKWLKERKQLSQGPLVKEFEEVFAYRQESKYAVFVNSGSSANLLIAYSLYVSDLLRNKKVVLPTLSWNTTISPFIQFGFHPILCDVDKETLGVDLEHLEHIFKNQSPSLLFLVDVLGIPNKYKEIKSLCEKYDVLLCIDDCECQESSYDNILTGRFGLMSSYSFFYSHMQQTIEGGMICTDDESFYTTLKMLRSHGWTRDTKPEFQKFCKEQYNVDDFNDRFTFYLPGFNLRATEIQAFLGLRQLNKVNQFILKRHVQFLKYQQLIQNNYWKVKPTENSWVSGFAYPIIHPKRNELVEALNKNNIATRPLISGSMSRQPFFKDLYGDFKMPFGDIVHEYGLYLPINPGMNREDVEYVCDVVNKVIN